MFLFHSFSVTPNPLTWIVFWIFMHIQMIWLYGDLFCCIVVAARKKNEIFEMADHCKHPRHKIPDVYIFSRSACDPFTGGDYSRVAFQSLQVFSAREKKQRLCWKCWWGKFTRICHEDKMKLNCVSMSKLLKSVFFESKELGIPSCRIVGGIFHKSFVYVCQQRKFQRSCISHNYVYRKHTHTNIWQQQ